MTRYFTILNPAAGGGRCGERARDAIDSLRTKGLELEVVETYGPGDATRLARQAWQEGERAFIAAGGDGTAFEVVNGLYPRAEGDDVPRLGFLPLGTGNSFLRDFTEDGADHAMAALVEDWRRTVDVVRLRHRGGELHYINILSLGFVADVCALTNRRFKSLGEGGYGLSVVLTLAGLAHERFPMRVDGADTLSDPVAFISVCNSRFTGGKMMMAPRADVADGKVDLIVAGPMGRVSLLRTFPKIFAGRHVDHPKVSEQQVRSIAFDVEAPVDIMIDGEVLKVAPTGVDVLPGALEVVA